MLPFQRRFSLLFLVFALFSPFSSFFFDGARRARHLANQSRAELRELALSASLAGLDGGGAAALSAERALARCAVHAPITRSRRRLARISALFPAEQLSLRTHAAHLP